MINIYRVRVDIYRELIFWRLLQIGGRKQSLLNGCSDVWHVGEGVGPLGRLLGEPLYQRTVRPHMIFFIDTFHLRLYDVKLETTLELQADMAFSIALIRSVLSMCIRASSING